MPKIKYVAKNFGENALEIIAQANAICTNYQAQGFDLTLRQLYYQFVARGLIPNKDTEYKRLGGIINDARLAGLVDWDHIVDRTRNLKGLRHFNDPADAIADITRRYHNDLWATQDTRVEVWIEKDALVGVLDNVCPGLDVSYFSCRGYTSQSEIWGAAQRLRSYLNAGQRVVVLHLGDHDPSGVDMTRDIRDRLELFISRDWHHENVDHLGPKTTMGHIWQDMDLSLNAPSGYPLEQPRGRKPFEVRRIALTMEQVRQYNPPPNPAKLSDTRARKYIQQYGSQSWELDALDPATLTSLITEAVEAEMDIERFNEAVENEKTGRTLLKKASKHWAKIVETLKGAA